MTRVVALLMLTAFFLLGTPGALAAASGPGAAQGMEQAAGRAPIPAALHVGEPAAQVSPQVRTGPEQRCVSGPHSEDGACEEPAIPAAQPQRRSDMAEPAPERLTVIGSDVHERGPPRTDRTAL